MVILYRLATSMMTYGVIEPVLDDWHRVQHKEGWYFLCAVPIWLLDNRIRSSRI
ncbi:DEHA2F20570p [Debaryomyces hansenii CBS767]|uniref:DEHA2F20570p n=1 Tax=Debaryomyces hansenii (strain ATCC 36239 / CBS 767 / BCRC 21394 / JCM 1990 / NBRC 0083 / IGC 2968) TaxID=284592 RepID=Q6BKM9_DEBHA|nr:DEHA2F20570p [Debaryomyces hansenii CBS767]CAG89630.1 DEHA2F20570p [Debaryomyces hansenii CBS767]|eukprot:XP_461242.1 DEHA2F20570p [Debaryomyces hansenii CBS767]